MADRNAEKTALPAWEDFPCDGCQLPVTEDQNWTLSVTMSLRFHPRCFIAYTVGAASRQGEVDAFREVDPWIYNEWDEGVTCLGCDRFYKSTPFVEQPTHEDSCPWA